MEIEGISGWVVRNSYFPHRFLIFFQHHEKVSMFLLFARMKSMKWQQLILVFIATICLLFAGNALAQTDININNTNLIRFGGSVTVPENQVVENALAFGGNVTVSPHAKVTAIAFGGDVILQKGARVEGDAYSFGGKIVQEPSAIVSSERATDG
jgi:membrane glycosyltransferase